MEATRVKAGQGVTVTGPDGVTHFGQVLDAYRSTGGIVSVWIDLCGDFSANPANRAGSDWASPVLVLTERDGVYCDLWLHQWEVRVLRND
jgi:hypothetical protein